MIPNFFAPGTPVFVLLPIHRDGEIVLHPYQAIVDGFTYQRGECLKFRVDVALPPLAVPMAMNLCACKIFRDLETATLKSALINADQDMAACGSERGTE